MTFIENILGALYDEQWVIALQKDQVHRTLYHSIPLTRGRTKSSSRSKKTTGGRKSSGGKKGNNDPDGDGDGSIALVVVLLALLSRNTQPSPVSSLKKGAVRVLLGAICCVCLIWTLHDRSPEATAAFLSSFTALLSHN